MQTLTLSIKTLLRGTSLAGAVLLLSAQPLHAEIFASTGAQLQQGIQPPASMQAVPAAVQPGTATTNIGIQTAPATAPASPPPVMPASAAPATGAAMQAARPNRLQATVATFSGGIAESGMAHVQSIEKDYSTKIVFSGEGGMFLADVNITITDSKGTSMVSGSTNGPVLLANLPAGRYTLEARYDNAMKKETLNITAPTQLKTFQVRMPVNESQETPVPPAGVTTIKR